LGNLSTPNSVQKLQTALHAKAKAAAGYRFYALYDKISREDILAHAYAQCRSNKGAPGVDGQDFADIETHGVERCYGTLQAAAGRWAELASADGLVRGRFRFDDAGSGLCILRDTSAVRQALLAPILRVDV
jgi:hypothetical protein